MSPVVEVWKTLPWLVCRFQLMGNWPAVQGLLTVAVVGVAIDHEPGPKAI
jgi:hypothetical protein